MYPVNSLRNMGLLLAATPLVMMADLDMLMSRELSILADGTDRQASSASPQPQSRSPPSNCNVVCFLTQACSCVPAAMTCRCNGMQ